MKYCIVIGLACLCMVTSTKAQGTVKAAVDDNGVPLFRMEDVRISAQGLSKKERKHLEQELKKFNKLRYNVIKVWPYANEAAKNLLEINNTLNSISSETEKEKYLKSKENSLFGKYEKEIRDLTFSQGKILIKLIDRQTGQTTYSLIKDLKSGTAAFFWQGIGKIFGYNLKTEYNPDEDDFAIEAICKAIENGSNTTYFDIIQANAQ